jgi:hypothetical protein
VIPAADGVLALFTEAAGVIQYLRDADFGDGSADWTRGIAPYRPELEKVYDADVLTTCVRMRVHAWTDDGQPLVMDPRRGLVPAATFGQYLLGSTEGQLGLIADRLDEVNMSLQDHVTRAIDNATTAFRRFQ